MAGDGEEKQLRNHRPSLKTHPSFSNYTNWKNKLRENCFRRVREDRSRLLWKLRLPDVKSQSSNNKDLINSSLQGIVSDELRKIKGSSLDESSAPTCCSATDDMIWEYDGLQTAYAGDCEEILLEMQRIFYEDLGRGEIRKGSGSDKKFYCENSWPEPYRGSHSAISVIKIPHGPHTGLLLNFPEVEPENLITTWEDEEDEYLAREVYDHMQLNSDQMVRIPIEHIEFHPAPYHDTLGIWLLNCGGGLILYFLSILGLHRRFGVPSANKGSYSKIAIIYIAVVANSN
ncbi:hypothetical protein SASPL_101805 [Salvia splendens]|uniref:Uncharacterized protein n=1 Tax=Salvia splendens TaxID=180675 RepID=A0A8X9ADL7_SALSN|nr:hypothetical protein SASPL_101805 [Salvia splendens]